ncbi:hypothetical protein T440DRAFT_530838 [Plenodomus tracheiphilus IPT5]|uniref:Uncharacterized protein n=1 Tax=Plenodomus tracheiphilus IPT5 TaxID=1408161 RepID=A0A6A7ALG7_9PLEO|nr:hypothetical protein T440DRAFT_530838 [Plenodomus tracheiphilus IPT5]
MQHHHNGQSNRTSPPADQTAYQGTRYTDQASDSRACCEQGDATGTADRTLGGPPESAGVGRRGIRWQRWGRSKGQCAKPGTPTRIAGPEAGSDISSYSNNTLVGPSSPQRKVCNVRHPPSLQTCVAIMLSESEQDSQPELLSDSQISELDLLDQRGVVHSSGASTGGDDEDDEDLSEYDSDTPSQATTADFDFLDDSSSGDLSASGSSYQPDSVLDFATSDSGIFSTTDSSDSFVTDSSDLSTIDSSVSSNADADRNSNVHPTVEEQIPSSVQVL